jgi:hypothetical protein
MIGPLDVVAATGGYRAPPALRPSVSPFRAG